MNSTSHHGNDRSRNADLDHAGHERGKVVRKLPLEECDWSFDSFADKVNRAEFGLKPRRRNSKEWFPDEDSITQIVKMLGKTRSEAILLLQAAMNKTK
jgi:hypothetical protein